MEFSISSKFLFPKQHLLLPFSPQFNPTTKTPSSFHPPPTPKRNLLKQIPYSISVSHSNSDSPNYGGWEDLKLDDDHPNHYSKLHNFVVSIGIDDTKHVFMLVLGFISALAISRVRVSSILVFPATVLVFSLGFSVGFLRRSPLLTDFSKAHNNHVFMISSNKLNALMELFGELNVKMANLEKDVSGAQQIGEVEECYAAVKSDILQAKNIVEAVTNNDGVSFVDDGRNLGHKSSRRRREPVNVFHFVGSLFQESANVLKPNKLKDVARREAVQPLNSKVANNQNYNNVLVQAAEQEKAINLDLENEVANHVINSSPPEASRSQADRPRVSTDGAKNKRESQIQLNGNSVAVVNDTRSNDEFSQENYISQLVNSGNSMKARRQNGKEMFMPQDNLYDSLGPNVQRRSSEISVQSYSMEFKASLLQEENLQVPNGYHVPSNRRKKEKNQSSTFDFIEKREKSGDIPNLVNQQTDCDSEDNSASLPSSAVSEDLIFNKNLTEATDLLKEARGYFKGKVDEDKAEVMLYKCAKLLSRATVLRPMSLLAVGQLGNTFLLHGELKLRVSRELRTLLSENDYFSRRKNHVSPRVLDEKNMSKDRIASTLVDVCEECEGLLVEAGRQYRMALSIDGSDVRALYNWGLALSYRAQLLADVGPEAASDADRVYLAAIDKFNEMMSRNKAYAPDALFRWGIALQQRSRLRPNNAKEKMKLLQQAKSLFEDALCMDSNNDQVRGALSSCISELNYRRY